MKDSVVRIAALLGFAVLILQSCGPEPQVDSDRAGQAKKVSNELLKVNHYIVKRNQELIENFVRRTGWDMKESGTGLWYMVTSHGKGKVVKDGDVVIISYRMLLLTGDTVETVPGDHPLTFTVGHGGVVSGLEEGIKYLHWGDSAIFILPPHLAYGNFGENGKIPPGAILIYELKLHAVK